MIDKEQFDVRDLRQKEQYITDDLFLNGYARFLEIYAVGVYGSLCRHANKEQKCWPSIQKIAEELGCGKNSIINAIKRLEFWNIVGKQRVGKKVNNRYLLYHKKHWKKMSEVCLKEYSEVCDINFTSLSDKLHKFITQTSLVYHTNFHSKELNSKELNIKETHSKEITKHLTEKELFFKRKIDSLIDLFKEINPSYKKFFSNTTQRGALQRLVEQHGSEKVTQFLEVLPTTNGMQYAPVITTPLALENKLGDLMVFIQKEKLNNRLIKL